ncbi:MAG: hypothetical protein ACO3LB_08265 [Flavobacteriaceae bacterium]
MEHGIVEGMSIGIGHANKTMKDWRRNFRGDPSGEFQYAVYGDGVEYNLGQRMFYAENVSVSYNPQIKLNRQADKIDIDQMYKQEKPITCNIDFDFTISNDHNPNFGDPYFFMRDDIPGGNNTGKNYFPITVGRNIYNKCYLNSISIDVKPFAPVTCKASFRSMEPASGQPLKGMYTAQNYSGAPNQLMDSNGFVLGHTCELSGWFDNLTKVDAISQITFNRTYNRKDVYCLGEEKPRQSLVKTVENRMTIKTSGINEMMPSSGIRISGDMGVIFKDSNGDRVTTRPLLDYPDIYPVDPGFYVHSGAYVVNQSFSVRKNDIIDAVIEIGEGIL